MDHVQNMMERYAVTLEAQINGRTAELMEEKKKADILLYRILPRYIFTASVQVQKTNG